jgi:hypothetical protein
MFLYFFERLTIRPGSISRLLPARKQAVPALVRREEANLRSCIKHCKLYVYLLNLTAMLFAVMLFTSAVLLPPLSSIEFHANDPDDNKLAIFVH